MKRRAFFKKLLGLGAAAVAAPVAAKAVAAAPSAPDPFGVNAIVNALPPRRYWILKSRQVGKSAGTMMIESTAGGFSYAWFPNQIHWTPEPYLVDPDSWGLIEPGPSTPQTRSPIA